MKRALLPLLAVTLFFGCKKNESPVVTSPSETFDEAAFIKSVEKVSADAIRRTSLSYTAQRGGPGKKFWRIIKIIGSDIIGGVTGALQGLQLTGNSTAGGITGGAAGASAASIKAAEQYAVTTDASESFKYNLKVPTSRPLNTHIPPEILELNPFTYLGRFHNAQMVKLTPNITTTISGISTPGDVPHHDNYNHSILLSALTNDPVLSPYYNEVLAMGKPYTFVQYRQATAFVDIYAYPTDVDYLLGSVGKISTYIIGGNLMAVTQSFYRMMFTTLAGLETIEEVEHYIFQMTLLASGFPDSHVDKEIMMQTMAIAAYSADFWYTMNE